MKGSEENDARSRGQTLLDAVKETTGRGASHQRRARFALHLIQSRAANVALGRHQQAASLMTEGAQQERSKDFLDAINREANTRVPVTIQDLEYSVDAWRELVPENPSIRAHLAKRIGDLHQFSARDVPKLRAALGIDSDAVTEAFESQTAESIDSIYTSRQSLISRMRWGWFAITKRVEQLPPFWMAFALTLTETVGAGALALPIAFATVGPTVGVALLLILGLVNVITATCLAEASARNGSIRYGSAYIGRLVEDYLGKPASLITRVGLFGFCSIILVSYYSGFGSTLQAMTGIPAPFWVCVIASASAFLILRKNLTGTLASAMLVGAVNVSILVTLSVMGFLASDTERLLYVEPSLVSSGGLDGPHLQLVFGVVLVAYFGHLSVSNCAQPVLRRDPSGSSLKWGTAAAMLTAIAVYCLWTVGVGGAVDATRLASEQGTALVPLAEAIGPEVYLVGSAFVLLGLGMSSVHFGLGIFNIGREFIENRPSDTLRHRQFLGVKASAIVSLLPIAAVFLYVQWTYLTDQASFAGPLKLIGVLLTPIIGGVIPVLLLLSSRRQGLPARQARIPRLVSNLPVLVSISALCVGSLLLHGLVIWESLGLKLTALCTAIVVAYLIIDAVRRGAFTPSACIEIRHFAESGDVARVMAAFNGETIAESTNVYRVNTEISTVPKSSVVENFSNVSDLTLLLPQDVGARVNVFAYSVSPDYHTSPLDGAITFEPEEQSSEAYELSSTTGTTRSRVPPPRWRAHIQLKPQSGRYALRFDRRVDGEGSSDQIAPTSGVGFGEDGVDLILDRGR